MKKEIEMINKIMLFLAAIFGGITIAALVAVYVFARLGI